MTVYRPPPDTGLTVIHADEAMVVIDKPSGPTSFDVVKKLRALGAGRKAGHVGTLDPMATGVLPLCLGDATKIAEPLRRFGEVTVVDPEKEFAVQKTLPAVTP